MSPIQQFQEEWAYNVPIPEPDGSQRVTPRVIPTPDASEIDRLIDGERTPATTSIDEAIGAVRIRFGVAYKYLPESFQQHEEIAWEAMLASMGQIFKTPGGKRFAASQDRSFFVKALHQGMPDWIVHFASPEMQNDPEIQSLVATAEEQRRNYLQNISRRQNS